VADCRCNAGHSGPNGGECTACVAGKYKDTAGSAECLACPSSSASLSDGSDSVTDCRCNAGYTGNNGGACTACVAGKYKDTVGPADCLDCPSSDSTSTAGSDNVTDCECNAGYTGNNGGACSACVAGKYKDSGSAECSSCPAGEQSKPVQRTGRCAVRSGKAPRQTDAHAFSLADVSHPPASALGTAWEGAGMESSSPQTQHTDEPYFRRGRELARCDCEVDNDALIAGRQLLGRGGGYLLPSLSRSCHN